MWADLTIALCNLGLSVGLIPTLRMGLKHQDVPYGTSVTYVILLSVMGIAMLSIGAVLGFISLVVGAGLWLGIVGERWWQHRHQKSSD